MSEFYYQTGWKSWKIIFLAKIFFKPICVFGHKRLYKQNFDMKPQNSETLENLEHFFDTLVIFIAQKLRKLEGVRGGPKLSRTDNLLSRAVFNFFSNNNNNNNNKKKCFFFPFIIFYTTSSLIRRTNGGTQIGRLTLWIKARGV